MNKNSAPLFSRMVNWLIKYNRSVIVFFAFFLFFFEIVEPLVKKEPLISPFHVAEIIFYFALLILVRVLIDYLIKANAVQNRTLEVLKYKHDISLELAKLENWEKLKVELTRLPSRIAAVETSRLHIINTISNKLELVACWSADGCDTADFLHDCQQCLRLSSEDKFVTSLCMTESDVHDSKSLPQEFCIPINYGNELLGLIQVRLKPGEKLSLNQFEIFESIRPEIALVLKVSQEQTALSEMQLARTALAERRTVSTFIHDQLGQNLGYLHLRLDQLVENKSLQGNKDVQVKLKRLRDVANDSYGIVRDILKTMRSETVPNITNLLQEQARSVSRRAKFALDFKSIGKPIPLSSVTQQSVFFAFCEILSNIEKHANANKVDVLVVWNDGILDISVADNGMGFEPSNMQGDDHFGLHIMQERISGVQGKLMINSSENSGTVVSISVPVQPIDEVSA